MSLGHSLFPWLGMHKCVPFTEAAQSVLLLLYSSNFFNKAILFPWRTHPKVRSKKTTRHVLFYDLSRYSSTTLLHAWLQSDSLFTPTSIWPWPHLGKHPEIPNPIRKVSPIWEKEGTLFLSGTAVQNMQNKTACVVQINSTTEILISLISTDLETIHLHIFACTIYRTTFLASRLS